VEALRIVDRRLLCSDDYNQSNWAQRLVVSGAASMCYPPTLAVPKNAERRVHYETRLGSARLSFQAGSFFDLKLKLTRGH